MHSVRICSVLGMLISVACSSNDEVPQKRVANPTVRGVVCDVSLANDAGADTTDASCVAMFDQCSDGLTYELDCRHGNCDCIVDGDKLGQFKAEASSACGIDIDELKVRCGWIDPRVKELIPVPER
jgi:hypothetical protein